MNVTQVRIQNYKSIIDTGWVPLEDEITTLLGKNESGKTSFLEAIRYFDEDREINERELHDDREYPEDHSVPIVSLRVELTSEGAERFSKENSRLKEGDEIISTKYSDGTRGFSTLQGKDLGPYTVPVEHVQQVVDEFWQKFNNLRNQYSGNFRNHFDNNIKQITNRIRNEDNPDSNQIDAWLDNLITNLGNTPEQNDEITTAKQNWLSELKETHNNFKQINNEKDRARLVPPIVYHSGFDTISDDVHVNSLNSDEYRTFRNLLELVGLDYQEFDQLNYHDQSRALETAEGTIRGQVNELWEQKEVDVDIRYRDNRFMIGIKDTAISHRQTDGDKTNKQVNRTLKRPSDRSKGFQWFFSFYVNLRAETNKETSSNQIILLDDPAVFLHPEGKKNWLKAIERMADSAQIIYSSHSPFLIRKEYPNRIRIVEDREEEGAVVTDNFHDSDAMTLEPLRNALGIGLGDSPFVSKRKILVEGVSDYDIITGLGTYFRDHVGEDILKWDEVTVMPTNGADNMIEAAKWVASEEFAYVLLMDNDQKGKNVVDRIENQHQEIDSDRVVFLEKDDGQRNYNIEVEDMFRPPFYISCLNAAYGEKLADFEPLEIQNQEDGSWLIDGYEYTGRKIVNRIEEALADRDLGDLNKILVADEIRDRLTKNRDVSEDDVEEFKSILGRIMSQT